MMRWRWEYELMNYDGEVSSRVLVQHDDELLEEIMDRFREFLRGCGWSVPSPIYDAGDEAYSDLLKERIYQATGRLRELAEGIGDWDEQEVRDAVDAVIDGLNGDYDE